MKPLEVCIKQYGGAAAFGRAIGVTRQVVWLWGQPQDSKPGAFDGNVPQKYWSRIVDHAAVNGIDVTMHDLIYGRE